MDLNQYKIVIDAWEGSGDYNEDILKENGVAALIIRMNESDGSLQLDEHFLDNWPEAAILKRAVYIVINPYISRANYLSWIKSHLPADCAVVCLDVEIRGSSSMAYSALVIGLLTDLQAMGLHVMLYSGAWFFNYVVPWPRQFDQWWARYLYALQPDPPQSITWEQLRAKLAAVSWSPFIPGYSEANVGHVALWQCSSGFYLPGFNGVNRTDINLMPNADFERIWGPVELTDHEKTTELWQWYLNHPELH